MEVHCRGERDGGSSREAATGVGWIRSNLPGAQDRVLAERSQFPEELCPIPRLHRDRSLVRQSTSEVDAQIFRTRGQEEASQFVVRSLGRNTFAQFYTHPKEAPDGLFTPDRPVNGCPQSCHFHEAHDTIATLWYTGVRERLPCSCAEWASLSISETARSSNSVVVAAEPKLKLAAS